MNYFDMHCDTLYECFETGKHLRENDLAVDRAKTRGFGHYAQVFALFCGCQPPEGIVRQHKLMDLPEADRLAALLHTAKTEFAANADWLTLCRTAVDFDRARQAGKTAAFLSIEGAELIDAPAHLDLAYDAGVRLVTLAWNYDSRYACGAASDNGKGLTDAGRALVKELAARQIVIDVSHLSEAGFWEVCALTDGPLVASHSNSRAVCGHFRNLTDEQFSEIVRRRGLVGLNLYSPFLRGGGARATLDDVRWHLDHFLSLGGQDCLALGADWDGCDTLPQGVETAGDIARLHEYLLTNHYPQTLVNGLLYENAAAFIHR